MLLKQYSQPTIASGCYCWKNWEIWRKVLHAKYLYHSAIDLLHFALQHQTQWRGVCNVPDISSKLFQSVHEVKAVCWGKGFGKANISTWSSWGNLPDLTWNNQAIGWVQALKMPQENAWKFRIWESMPRLHWPHELRTGRAQPCRPRTLPKKEYSSRTVSWAHFLAVSGCFPRETKYFHLQGGDNKPPSFSMVTVKTNLEISQKQSVSTATVTTWIHRKDKQIKCHENL